MKLEQAWKRFFADFDEFLALEERIAPFNLFEALGVERAEIRHSNFLAYVLDPNRRHGLGTELLRRFLYGALTAAECKSPSPAEVMIADFDQTRVERERGGIDLLVTIESELVVVAIENKIDSGETGDQLARYHDWVEAEFADGWRRVYLFLSPTGRAPSHPAWLPLSYESVVTAIGGILSTRAMTLGTDLRLALEHYLEMIRRHVLDEDRNREIALKLYQKHQEVFDYIIASVPRLGDIIATACMEVVGERDDVVKLGFPRSFKPAALLGKPVVGEVQGDAARALYFEISIGGEVKLYLYLGPGPAALRERIFAVAGAAGAPFSPKPALTPFWTSLLSEKLVSRTEMKRLSPAEASRLAQERLVNFLDANLDAVALTVLSVVDPGPLPPVTWR